MHTYEMYNNSKVVRTACIQRMNLWRLSRSNKLNRTGAAAADGTEEQLLLLRWCRAAIYTAREMRENSVPFGERYSMDITQQRGCIILIKYFPGKIYDSTKEKRY